MSAFTSLTFLKAAAKDEEKEDDSSEEEEEEDDDVDLQVDAETGWVLLLGATWVLTGSRK